MNLLFAIMNCYKQGGFKQQKFLLIDQEAKIKALARLDPSEVLKKKPSHASFPASGDFLQPLAFFGLMCPSNLCLPLQLPLSLSLSVLSSS
jgi:hypothetical protein